MKEIDFLPEWYKSGRRREVSYRTQYIALGAIFVVMMTWNIITARSISKGVAQLVAADLQTTGAQEVSHEFNKVNDQMIKLQERAGFIEKINSKIDVAKVLAELSFLIDERTVLSRVQFVAEQFTGGKGARPNSRSTVRVAGGNFAAGRASQDAGSGGVRFKVMIVGIALDASDVARLVCKLEDSPYFHQVYPMFSRNKKIKAQANRAGDNSFETEVSEFEIGCYLANYRNQ